MSNPTPFSFKPATRHSHHRKIIWSCLPCFCSLLLCWTVFGPPTAFPLIGPQCTVGVLAGTHWDAHWYPGRMVSGTKHQPSGCCSAAATAALLLQLLRLLHVCAYDQHWTCFPKQTHTKSMWQKIWRKKKNERSHQFKIQRSQKDVWSRHVTPNCFVIRLFRHHSIVKTHLRKEQRWCQKCNVEKLRFSVDDSNIFRWWSNSNHMIDFAIKLNKLFCNSRASKSFVTWCDHSLHVVENVT